MIGWKTVRRLVAVASCVAVSVTGCAFGGVNSLPLPGVVGRGTDALTYHVKIANVGTLEPNSPVMIGDVVVGSVGDMTVENWHADVVVSVEPDVVVPANVVAKVGQTSLLGSMHLSLDPPVGEPPRGRLEPGTTIVLNKSSTYPSTEETLSSLSVVVNGGGLGQIGDIVRNFSVALDDREDEIRDLLTRLDNFVGTLDRQRDNIVASIESMNRLAGTLAGQRDVIAEALRKIPPALDVLIRERPRITAAMQKLGEFSDIATRLVNDSQADLVRNLQNLQPALKALADVGPDLGEGLAQALVFPFTQDFIDRAVRGDYLNQYIVLDLTVPRLKRALLLGTRWGQEGAPLVAAPGDPYFGRFTRDPIGAPIALPPSDALSPTHGVSPEPEGALPMPPVAGPIRPAVPPPAFPGTSPAQTAGSGGPIFAGPYPEAAPAPGGDR